MGEGLEVWMNWLEAQLTASALRDYATSCSESEAFHRDLALEVAERIQEEMDNEKQPEEECSFPDCGCAEQRLCNAGEPNFAARALNRPAKDGLAEEQPEEE